MTGTNLRQTLDPVADQLPPHDELAERNVLGAMLLEPNACAEAFTLPSDVFYLLSHQVVHRALMRLHRRGIAVDVITLNAELKATGEVDDAGGLAYYSQLPNDTTGTYNLPYWIGLVRKAFAQRQAVQVVHELQDQIQRNPDRAGLIIATGADALTQIYRDHCDSETTGGTPRNLTLRSPDEILGMEFNDSDIILGDRLLAQAQSLVIAGQGGLGKSRLILFLVACIVSGRNFFSIKTNGRHLRFLFLQTENSNRRLQGDLTALRAWLGDDWPAFADQVIIHTVENDSDGFVSLDSPENQLAIERAIQTARPDVIVFDPLNDFSIGDPNKDSDMKATVKDISRLARKGNPNRAIIVLHHALTGKGGAAKATGFDRSSFTRNSKTLYAWTRGQINLAPVDAENNERLIVACGKCSNGREFQAFGIRLNPETLIYELDPSIDVAEWQKEISGESDHGPLITHDRVAELCKSLSSKAELAKAIMEDCGCVRGSAYRYITRATGKTIKHNKQNDTYSRK